MGSILGYRVKTGDAKGAYTQSLLRGVKAQVTPPERQWQKHWTSKFRRPVVPLTLALYGHADAGGFWEQYCEAQLVSIRLERISEEWPGVFLAQRGKSDYNRLCR